MSSITKKWIAVLLAIWLPLFTGNALAASVLMQMSHDACDTILQMDACDQMTSVAPGQTDDQQDAACADCGLCHLACSAYLTMPEINNDVTMGVAKVIPGETHAYVSVPRSHFVSDLDIMTHFGSRFCLLCPASLNYWPRHFSSS